MKSYKAIRAQIAKLEQQAEVLRRTQVKAVIAQLKKTIDEYGLTAEELGLGAVKAAAPRRARKAAGAGRKTVGVARYRDPKTGQTWTGRGRPPAWIVDAKDREAFLIAGAPAAEPEVKPAPAKRAKVAKRAKASRPAKPAAKPAAKRTGGRKPAAKKAGKSRAATKTPAVQIESGVAME